MNAFLAKPVSSAELVHAIASVLARHAPPAPPTANPGNAEDKLFERAALERFADDIGRDLLPGIMQKIASEMVRRLGEMRALAARSEHAALQREAHALKGSAATIGLIRLAALARHLERNAATLESAAIATAIDEIDAAYAAGWALATAG